MEDIINREEEHPEVKAGVKHLEEAEKLAEEAIAEEQFQDQSDYSEFSKEAILEKAEASLHLPDTRFATEVFRKLHLAFDTLLQQERQDLLRQWVEEGNEPRDFKAPADSLRQRFNALELQFRERKADEKRRAEEEKMANYKKKLSILDQMKDLVDAEETKGSLDKIKELQKEWRLIKSIPLKFRDDLYERYRFYLDKFYDNLSIENELKQRDREVNLSAKIDLCIKMDELLQEKSIKNAMILFNKYREDWSNVGPVPRDVSDEIYRRFKETADKVLASKKEQMETINADRQNNLKLKVLLCEKLEALNAVWPETGKQWAQRAEEVDSLMEEWKKTGQGPRQEGEEAWNRFRETRQEFFNARRNFFKKLGADREENLQKKLALCEQAEKLSDRNDWGKTTEELLKLQESWKKIGPTPEQKSDEVWKRFRSAFDAFFDRKNQAFKARKSEEKVNLKVKTGIVEALEALAAEETSDELFARLKTLQGQWMQTGFVPAAQKEDLQKRFQKISDELYGRFRKNRDEVKQSLMKEHFESMAGSPDGANRLKFEERRIRDRITALRGELSTMENNMAFFSRSKGADTFLKQFEEKKVQLEQQIKRLEQELKTIRTMKPGHA
jgi:hypothetical protein